VRDVPEVTNENFLTIQNYEIQRTFYFCFAIKRMLLSRTERNFMDPHWWLLPPVTGRLLCG
jgi:hypothetical protein